MKYFSFFVFLNVLILFAYAQNPAGPTGPTTPNPLDVTTCEQSFALQNGSCTPCQQALFQHNIFINISDNNTF